MDGPELIELSLKFYDGVNIMNEFWITHSYLSSAAGGSHTKGQGGQFVHALWFCQHVFFCGRHLRLSVRVIKAMLFCDAK